MAILKSVVDVNNGNTGWTTTDVMDALETVFANLGWHGGETKNGSPSSLTVQASDWNNVGGQTVSGAMDASNYPITRFLNLHPNPAGTAWRVRESWSIDASKINTSTDSITLRRHSLQTGDPIIFAEGGNSGTNPDWEITGLSQDTVYYAIKVDKDTIKLAANATDASNGTAVDIQSTPSSGPTIIRTDTSACDNLTINVRQGDYLNFALYESANTPVSDMTAFYAAHGAMFIVKDKNAYASNNILNSINFTIPSYAEDIYGDNGSGQNVTAGEKNYELWFNTKGWRQTEHDAYPEYRHPAWTGVYNSTTGRTQYWFVSDVVSTAKFEIVVEPGIHYDAYMANTENFPYWKATIPASGSRSELTFKVARVPRQYGSDFYVHNVSLWSIGSGWAEGETFSIPGNLIGGATPANDINFGSAVVNETGSNIRDGVAKLLVTNLGSGSNFYQKHVNGRFAVLKLVNDNSKTYGTTYWAFGLDVSNPTFRMSIQSGNGWTHLNYEGTNTSYNNSDNGGSYYGRFTGIYGVDVQSSYQGINRNTNTTYFDYASSATPTAYPLSIATYKAQAPQDTNFVIIQFRQTINGNPVPYATFTIHKGGTFGSGVWGDLENVYLGAMTNYYAVDRKIETVYEAAGHVYKGYETLSTNYSLTREANYGYFRNVNGGDSSARTRYGCNIDTNNETNDTGYYEYAEAVIYYRNSTYDQVSSAANYYKPIKGIPVANNIIPCPYYMPDDIVLLQVATPPGLTYFRPDDTVTVSGSEVYEIILAGYQNNQNGLDNINNNSTIGMLLMARIV